MPPQNNSFVKIVLFAAALTGVSTECAHAEDLLYTDVEADCAARMIYANECSGKEQNLLFWSPDEAFPSMGIGHFIWYPEGSSGPFLESFPGFLKFAAELGLTLPDWVAQKPLPQAPWKTRQEFLDEGSSERMRGLRVFLRDTKREQAHYILRRFNRIFPSILDDLNESDRKPIREKYELLMKNYKGTFAMVDYVNFKGEGFRTDARYNGVGWGLAQVLQEMTTPDDPDKALDEFISAAGRVLERRVEHSPRPDVERKWLPGWKNRLQSYKSIAC